MVSASPHTDVDVAGGYRHGRPILGFGQVHFSGSPPVLGLVLLRPTSGALMTAPRPSAVASEDAAPGYYRARLAEDAVDVEATVTVRTALYRLTFRDASRAKNVLIDASHVLGLRPREAHRFAVTHVDRTHIEGWAQGGALGGLGGAPLVYFVAALSEPADAAGAWRDVREARPFGAAEPLAGAWWRFERPGQLALLVRIGISYVDLAGARRNLVEEQGARGFDDVRADARRAWNEALARIEIDGGSDAERTGFYTALYHALLHPSIFDDTDGRYRRYLTGTVGRLPRGEHRYTGFSLWDTFRTVHPLLAFAYPERSRAMTASLLAMRDEGGWLPQWELAGQEANAMVGDPAAVVIAESYVKGIAGDDGARALAALEYNATHEPAWQAGRGGNKGRIGLAAYLRLGYVPEPAPRSRTETLIATARALWQRATGTFSAEGYENAHVYGSVSTTQDYAYADACIARLAESLGRGDDAARYARRAVGYRQLYDSTVSWPLTRGIRGAFRARRADGTWAYSARLGDPRRRPRAQTPGFVEGDAWSYMFNAPHDVGWLVAAAGGRPAFERRLATYVADSALDETNEPTIGYPYLAAAIGHPALTGSVVRRLLTARLSRERAMAGDDDAGTLSAWTVWSALGLYPYDACRDELVVGLATFDRVTVRDERGDAALVVEARRREHGERFVVGASLNGRALPEPRVRASALRSGARLRLVTSDAPAPWRGDAP
jgi:predicted alpha-1,2-mannosidase